MNKPVLLILLLISFTSCTQTPTQRTLSICPNCQKHPIDRSNKYPTQSFSKNINTNKAVLHVYLEGDGLPWTRYGTPNTNPSSHKLTVLKLMSLDNNPSLYINRPCYGFSTMPSNCSNNLWTKGRYSKEVVQAINEGINNILADYSFEELILIGHSGGGTLAMLIAKRRKDVTGIVTLGANLDHKAWTNHFNSPPLIESLDLSKEPPLSSNIFRWHLAGDKDKQVPASLTKNAAHKDFFSTFILKKGYNHNCCWHQSWPKILTDIDLRLKMRKPPATNK